MLRINRSYKALLLLIPFLSIPSWLSYCQIRQARLDHALIAAIQQNNTVIAVSLLAQGANPNARALPPDNRSFWQRLLDNLRARHHPIGQAPSALMMALNSPARSRSFWPAYQDTTPIVKALLD